MSRRGLVRTCLAVIVATTAFACSRSAAPPSAPASPATPSAREDSTVTICHLGEAGTFAATVIPSSATLTHLTHGDAFPGHFLPNDNKMRFDAACKAVAVTTSTLTLSGLTNQDAPITSFEEQGFRITVTTGSWVEWPKYGAPAPSMVFLRQPSTLDLSAEIEVRLIDGLFSFDAIDLYSSVTPIPYTIAGKLDLASSLMLTGTVPNTFGKFARVANPNPPHMLDRLSITLVNPGTACCSNPVGLDNITLKR